MATMLRIALASPPVSGSVDAAMPWVERFIAEAAAGGADIVCFPECYVPGLRGQDFAVEAHDPVRLAKARERVRELAATHRIAVIIPMDWDGPEGILNVAFVISADGKILGCQTKNQVAPEEDAHYVPGRGREMFEVNGVPFAISICHEGWRYPESVRWGRGTRRGGRLPSPPRGERGRRNHGRELRRRVVALLREGDDVPGAGERRLFSRASATRCATRRRPPP